MTSATATSEQPLAREVPARVRDQETCENRGCKKRHRIFRHHAQTGGGTGRKPPSRVFGPEQTDNEISSQDPADVVERDILHERSGAEGKRKVRGGGQQLGLAPSTHLARHQSRQD